MVRLWDLAVAVSFSCLLALVCLWCWIKWKHRQLIQVASNMPSIFPTLPIIGNLHYTLFGIEKLTGWALESGQELAKQDFSTAVFWLGPFPIVYVFGVEDLQKVLTSIKVPVRGFEMDTVKFVLGNGLLTAPAHIWKNTRRAIEPIFHPRNLRHLIPTFNRNCRDLVTRMSQYEGRGSFDVFPVLINTTLQSVCHLLFGPELEFDPNTEEFQNLVSLLKTVPEMGYNRLINFWLQSDTIFNFVYRKKLKEIDLQWDRFSKGPLKISMRNNEIKKLQNTDIVENGNRNKATALKEGPENLINVYTTLQETCPDLTDDDLKSELITMYFTGSDTISIAVSSCLLLLAKHQDIQNRLYEEISSVVDLESDVTVEDLQKMPYLDQVYKESLRWAKILPFASRRTMEDIKLSSCTLKKGTTFLLGIIGPFMNPKIYPDPSRFNPDHFSPENAKSRDKYAFQPFVSGPRHCIGKLYTDYLFRIMVAHVLMKFKLSTNMEIDNPKRKLTIFLSLTEGYQISLQSRSQ